MSSSECSQSLTDIVPQQYQLCSPAGYKLPAHSIQNLSGQAGWEIKETDMERQTKGFAASICKIKCIPYPTLLFVDSF